MNELKKKNYKNGMKSASGSHLKLEGHGRVLTQTCWRSVIFTPCSDTEEARQL